ncbi:unnamed protein product [Phytophthora fragariaefolia]|uniref:Unnamed protein product n=1 Tax=Phytophthora fragariaefolia TaxID=1490495 RepID=A0A9W7CT42_9STRA|nr:unnamed protein product [Phytophthora fragariaefolia]
MAIEGTGSFWDDKAIEKEYLNPGDIQLEHAPKWRKEKVPDTLGEIAVPEKMLRGFREVAAVNTERVIGVPPIFVPKAKSIMLEPEEEVSKNGEGVPLESPFKCPVGFRDCGRWCTKSSEREIGRLGCVQKPPDPFVGDA